jgi:hypothetical protein
VCVGLKKEREEHATYMHERERARDANHTCKGATKKDIGKGVLKRGNGKKERERKSGPIIVCF